MANPKEILVSTTSSSDGLIVKEYLKPISAHMELRRRNKILFWFGLACLFSALVCFVLIYFTNIQVLGINAFIKPSKFFLSVTIMSWTFGWLLVYLQNQRAVRIFSWATVILMGFELVIITMQAAQGKKSHFNISTPADALLFSLMGVAITVFVFWVAYIAWLFYSQKTFTISYSFLWGIRLGMTLFVVYALTGFVMVANMAHTVGAPDGGPGLPYTNWSTQYGDLRVAHFFGMHSLQFLPFVGWLLNNNKNTIKYIAVIYFATVAFLLAEALVKKPLI